MDSTARSGSTRSRVLLLLAFVAAGLLLSFVGGGRALAQTVPETGTPAPVAPVTDVRDAGTPAPAAAAGETGTLTGANPTATAGSGSGLTPAAPTAPQAPGSPSLTLNLKTDSGKPISQPVTLIVLLTVLSLAPALLILVTSFTRIVIVLGLTRNALNLNGVPPNQVLIGLSLFLTLFVMGPVFTKVNAEAVQPYLKGQITQQQAYDKGIKPFRAFMFKQTRERDLGLFTKLSGKPRPKNQDAVPTTTLIPAFVISELRAAFLIGFVIFVPFLVIDIVASAALMSMGMVMLPPVLISLPFKLLLFVVVDGWYLVVQSLVKSFVT
jgi:flagellar biosynthetic protein FliP